MPNVPPYNELMWPTLQSIKSIGGSGTIEETEVKVIELGGFTEEQQALLHGDGPQTEIGYRLAWARSYLKAVGALENSARGVWAITEKGRELTEADMAEIPARVRAMQRRERPRRRDRRREEQEGPIPVSPVADESWKDSLLDVLVAMRSDAFERLSQRLLREAGFISVEISYVGAADTRTGVLASSPDST